MPVLKQIVCEECGETAMSYGVRFCSRRCANVQRNRESNPAKTTEARAKISAHMKATNTAARLQTPEARAKAVPKIAAAKRGRKQSSEWVERRVQGWKRGYIERGGMSEAHSEQLARIQASYSGPKHHNWNGGTTKERVKEYRLPEYKAFREAVLERDNYTCQECGSRGGRLEVHHILPYAQCRDALSFLKYEPENGTTLCRTCHNMTKTTRPDLEQPAFSQLPEHVIQLIVRKIGPKL